jgi:hypothetical protein
MQMARRSRQKLQPHEKAHATGRWAEIMLRALSSRVADRWKFVSFRGTGNGEWRGIVDVLALRKNTGQPRQATLKRGDLFDIILIQMKGGGARSPSDADLDRLRQVARYYHAQKVVLYEWRLGILSHFSVLRARNQWKQSTCRKIFG